MVKFVAKIIKHKIISIVTLIVVVIGVFIGYKLIINPSPQDILNRIEFKASGYNGNGKLVISDSSKDEMGQLYKKISLIEAKEAKFNEEKIKKLFDNSDDVDETFKRLQNGESNIYDLTKESSNFRKRMVKVEVNKPKDNLQNGQKVNFSIVDNSINPAFKKISKEVKISGLKKKKLFKVKLSDFTVKFDNTNYQKAIKKEMSSSTSTGDEEQKRESAELWVSRDDYTFIFYKNTKIRASQWIEFDDFYDKFIEKEKFSDDDLFTFEGDSVDIKGYLLIFLADPNADKNFNKTKYSLEKGKYYTVKMEKY